MGDSGIGCPICGHEESSVADSRPSDGYIRRRRKCLKCGGRYTTREMVESNLETDSEVRRRVAKAMLEKIMKDYL